MFVSSNLPIATLSRGRALSEIRKASKVQFADWMKENMDRLRMSQNQLAKKAGISTNTISRYCSPDDGAEPKASYVRQIAEVFGVKAPPPYGFEEVGPARGLHEPGVELLPEEPGFNWNGNISHWRVKDDAMMGMGYLVGDLVTADARIQPVDGDVVIANLYSTSGQARTMLRVFKTPGYLLPASPDARQMEVHEIGKNAAIFGVVTELVRRRQEH